MDLANNNIFYHIGSDHPSTEINDLLFGKTFAIQPNFSVRGWPTDAGSPALKGFKAFDDATVIRLIKAAGATIKGSTRMSELGFGLAGDTTSLAVKKGHADVAVMIDTMGEARLAALSEGLVGFKPSFGLVSRLGLIGLIPSMECCGLAARNPLETAKVMEIISEFDPGDFSMPRCDRPRFNDAHVSRTRIGVLGVPRESFELLDKEQSGIFRNNLAEIERAGHTIIEVTLDDLDICRMTHNVIGSVEASSSTGKYDSVRYGHRTAQAKNWNEMYIKSRGESFGMPLKGYIFQGAYFQYNNYKGFLNACRIRGRILRKTTDLFNDIKALVLPAMPTGITPENTRSIGAIYDFFFWTLLASLTGQPAVTLPGPDKGNLKDPGLQIIGPTMDDAGLLSLAARLAEQFGGNEN